MSCKGAVSGDLGMRRRSDPDCQSLRRSSDSCPCRQTTECLSLRKAHCSHWTISVVCAFGVPDRDGDIEHLGVEGKNIWTSLIQVMLVAVDTSSASRSISRVGVIEPALPSPSHAHLLFPLSSSSPCSRNRVAHSLLIEPGPGLRRRPWTELVGGLQGTESFPPMRIDTLNGPSPRGLGCQRFGQGGGGGGG